MTGERTRRGEKRDYRKYRINKQQIITLKGGTLKQLSCIYMV